MSTPITKENFALLGQTAAKPGLFAAMIGGLRWLVELPRRQALMDELGRLSDRELTDIGLTRAELRHVVSKAR